MSKRYSQQNMIQVGSAYLFFSFRLRWDISNLKFKISPMFKKHNINIHWLATFHWPRCELAASSAYLQLATDLHENYPKIGEWSSQTYSWEICLGASSVSDSSLALLDASRVAMTCLQFFNSWSSLLEAWANLITESLGTGISGDKNIRPLYCPKSWAFVKMPQHIGWQKASGHALEAGARITGVSAKFRAEFLPVPRAMRALTTSTFLWKY